MFLFGSGVPSIDAHTRMEYFAVYTPEDSSCSGYSGRGCVLAYKNGLELKGPGSGIKGARLELFSCYDASCPAVPASKGVIKGARLSYPRFHGQLN